MAMIIIISLFNTSRLLIVAFIRLPPSLSGVLTLFYCTNNCGDLWHIATGMVIIFNDYLKVTVQG